MPWVSNAFNYKNNNNNRNNEKDDSYIEIRISVFSFVLIIILLVVVIFSVFAICRGYCNKTNDKFDNLNQHSFCSNICVCNRRIFRRSHVKLDEEKDETITNNNDTNIDVRNTNNSNEDSENNR